MFIVQYVPGHPLCAFVVYSLLEERLFISATLNKSSKVRDDSVVLLQAAMTRCGATTDKNLGPSVSHMFRLPPTAARDMRFNPRSGLP